MDLVYAAEGTGYRTLLNNFLDCLYNVREIFTS